MNEKQEEWNDLLRILLWWLAYALVSLYGTDKSKVDKYLFKMEMKIIIMAKNSTLSPFTVAYGAMSRGFTLWAGNRVIVDRTHHLLHGVYNNHHFVLYSMCYTCFRIECALDVWLLVVGDESLMMDECPYHSLINILMADPFFFVYVLGSTAHKRNLARFSIEYLLMNEIGTRKLIEIRTLRDNCIYWPFNEKNDHLLRYKWSKPLFFF